MGFETVASGYASTSMGQGTTASGFLSTSMGDGTIASGNFSTSMGSYTKATGNFSTSMGNMSVASGGYSISMGKATTASGNYSTSMGFETVASGEYSSSMGLGTTASGYASTSMGQGTTASGDLSTSMGSYTTASGILSTGMGGGTTASGYYSTSMGNGTTASGTSSTGMGNNTKALGDYSTSMGYITTAIGNASTSMGSNTRASGFSSTSIGLGTVSRSIASLAVGMFNDSIDFFSSPTLPFDLSPLFIIGNGNNDTARNNAMVVLKNGNAGFGTNTPQRPVHIKGALRLEPLASSPSSPSKGDIFFDNTTNTLKYYNGSIWVNMNESYWTLNGNNIYNNNSSGAGNVGIGTSTPNAPLQFGNNIANRKLVLFDAFNNDHQFYGFGINAGTLRYQTDAASSDHVFFSAINTTSSKELVRIKGNGNVGIGTSSPQFPLHVFSPGGVLFGNGAGNIGTMQFSTTSDVSPVSGRLSFGTDGTGWQFRIAKNTAGTVADLVTVGDNGNMGIGTTTPTQKLHVIGNILASGTITPSDLRYKKDIELIDHPLEKIEEIRGVTYKLKTDEYPESGFAEETQAGVIAQEVEAVLPQVVVTDQNGYKAVDYSKMVPLLIEGIKAQQKQIEELKKRVKKLEKK
jgi:hypothetical protein